MARWYIIHAYSGFENKVRDSILAEAERLGLEALVEAVEVPSETVTEVKHGAEIALLKPDSKAGMTVNEALENRRSWREYAPEALSLEELSGVMWAAGGVNRPADGRLTAPSDAASASNWKPPTPMRATIRPSASTQAT